MATALARADMRAATPSTKAAARAVRSLKKKIARLVELEGRRDSGKDLSADQVCFVMVFCTVLLFVHHEPDEVSTEVTLSRPKALQL